jgi:hypothetical protein
MPHTGEYRSQGIWICDDPRKIGCVSQSKQTTWGSRPSGKIVGAYVSNNNQIWCPRCQREGQVGNNLSEEFYEEFWTTPGEEQGEERQDQEQRTMPTTAAPTATQTIAAPTETQTSPDGDQTDGDETPTVTQTTAAPAVTQSTAAPDQPLDQVPPPPPPKASEVPAEIRSAAVPPQRTALTGSVFDILNDLKSLQNEILSILEAQAERLGRIESRLDRMNLDPFGFTERK